MTGDRPTTPGWHCHRCRSTSCRQRADSDTDHVGRVEYRPLLLTQPSSVSWLWSHTHWCPSQRPQEVMRVDGSANPTMPKNPAQYTPLVWVNEKSSAQFVYVRLSEWLGWPQASPREPLRCHISSLVIVETLKDSFEETQTRQTVLWSPVNENSTLRDHISKGWVRA